MSRATSDITRTSIPDVIFIGLAGFLTPSLYLAWARQFLPSLDVWASNDDQSGGVAAGLFPLTVTICVKRKNKMQAVCAARQKQIKQEQEQYDIIQSRTTSVWFDFHAVKKYLCMDHCAAPTILVPQEPPLHGTTEMIGR